MSDALDLQVHIAAAPVKVFHALTEEAAVATWLAEKASISLSEQRFEFWGRSIPQGDRPRQTFLAAEDDRLLRFSWTLDGRPTTVDIDLRPDGGRTKLRLRQDGLPTLEELMAPTGRRDGLHSMHTFWGLALANLAEYSEGWPPIPKADFRPERAPEIRVCMEIDASRDDVFDSLTDPVLVARWFGWEVEIEPRLGGIITLGADGRIFEFDPGKTLAYSDGEGSITRWELEDADGGTMLNFVQSGYTEDEWDNAAQHEAGWLGSLAELRRMHRLGDEWVPLVTELPRDNLPADDQA